jgi:hypothetical protein
MRRWWDLNQNLVEVWFWTACIIPTLLWWRESVLWVALMSLYANIKTAHGAHEAHRARKAAEDD